MKTEAQLVREIGAAKTLNEQMALVEQLDALKRGQASRARAERDLDWSASIVDQTFTPTRVHEMHTASTDWLAEVDTAPDNAHSATLAEAALWYQRLSADVKGDAEEFREQALGMARRTAGRYGEQAQASERAFLDYVAFLRQREAASGLDQVQQTTAPDGVTDKPTPLPQDVFDTFDEPVGPGNEGVDEAQSSDNAPLIQEIMSGGNGGGESGDPSHHDEAPMVSQGSVALNHAYTLDEFRAAEAARQRVATQRPQRARGVRREVVARVEAASTLPQIEQTVDSFENPAPTPMPADVAFPIVSLPEPQSTQPGETSDVAPTNAEQQAEKEGKRSTAARLRIAEATQSHPDYRKAYRFASRWTPGQPLVRMGSAQFEAGILAGLCDNPKAQAFVQASGGHPDLAKRIALHTAYFQRLAETTTDLDTSDPSSSPDATNTPINGAGTTPELAGGQNPAAPGGPAPYNGTPPYGSPVTSNPGWMDPQDSTTTQQPMGGPTPDVTQAPQITPQARFRQTVQANLLRERKSR